MSDRTMTAADFEPRYADDLDPWDYHGSRYEQDKYRATLEACGPGPIAHALELGGSIGVFTAMLAPRCTALVTVDASPTAAHAARQEVAAYPHVDVREGVLPGDLPPGTFDLVVASEILYYLSPADLERTLDGLRPRLAPGGALVAVHWRPRTAERELDAADVHGALGALPWLERTLDASTPDYLLERFTCR